MVILGVIHVKIYLNQAIVYVKYFSQTFRILFFLMTSIQVALVYSSNDPINFICAFYGCLLAGIVPLPIDVPLARRV
jgi:acyl-CoA synthetase (AMP-forming)/AMP-acid ligase II